MRQIDMVTFIDQASGQSAFIVVHADDGQVALGLSLEEDGDFEAVLKPEVCEQLVTALQQALHVAQEKGGK